MILNYQISIQIFLGLPGDKKYKFSIKGNPSTGSIKTLMIGVKNPSTQNGDVIS